MVLRGFIRHRPSEAEGLHLQLQVLAVLSKGWVVLGKGGFAKIGPFSERCRLPGAQTPTCCEHTGAAPMDAWMDGWMDGWGTGCCLN